MVDSEIQSFIYLNSKKKVVRMHSPSKAVAYYSDMQVDLLTGKKNPSNIKKIKDVLREISIGDIFESPKVIHLNYNLGFYLGGHENIFKKNKLSQLLMIEVEYGEVSDFKTGKTTWGAISLIVKPLKNLYKQKFDQCYEALLCGDSYQINLTSLFKIKFKLFSIEKFIKNFFSSHENLGAYAHATIIPAMNWGFVSNSPECLFQVAKKQNCKSKFQLWSMPIKGTKKIENENERKQISKNLLNDTKNQNELNIIIDLVRNDLSRIEQPNAKVTSPKISLSVPGLAHLASIIQVELSSKINLLHILRALFPGGSITGAPKIKVMQLIQKIESYNRSFYTGSTVVLWQPKGSPPIFSGSINIRSLELNLKMSSATYGSGGGITLRSKCEDEYREMLAKFESFKRFF